MRDKYVFLDEVADDNLVAISRRLALAYGKARWKWEEAKITPERVTTMLVDLVTHAKKTGNCSCGGLRVLHADGKSQLLVNKIVYTFWRRK